MTPIKITKEIKNKLYEIFQRIFDNKKSEPFQIPVNPEALGIPSYREIITNPMDLGTIRKKIDDNEYIYLNQFEDDFDLMFQNAMTFNHSKTQIYRWASDLKKIFHNQFAKINLGKRFTEYDECARSLGIIMSSRYEEVTWPFITPVDRKDVPNYYDIIKEPMDLGSIKQKLERGFYENQEQVVEDLDLIIKNCHTFNQPGDSIYLLGAKLKNIINKYFKKEVLKSDDIVKEINRLKNQIETLTEELKLKEGELFSTRYDEGNQHGNKVYTMDERIKISAILSELDDEKATKIAKLLSDHDNSVNMTKDYVEVDLKIMPDAVVKEIDDLIATFTE